MIVEKEVIRPGTYWYRDQQTGDPRKLVVTPELTRYWNEQGNAMLATGLTIPVPCEHDFSAHPMTPADRLKDNAGWVSGYSLKGDRLFSTLDIQDAGIAAKLPGTIRWTSPWINSFTDGNGKRWENVISHLALTTRPRITEQAPFPSVAAALSMASTSEMDLTTDTGVCLSRAGRLARRKRDKHIMPLYPIAFSMYTGIALADFPPKKSKKPGMGDDPEELEEPEGGDLEDDAEGSEPLTDADAGGDAPPPSGDDNIDLEPFGDPAGDVSMTELLCDLLGALGIHCESSGNEEMFKRELYNAAMTKIHELTAKGQNDGKDPNRTNPPGSPPNNPKPQQGQQNPLIQQEQQPMYMSLEQINALPDPMKSVALAMYQENVKLRGEMEASKKVTNSLRDGKLKEAEAARKSRVALLSKLSPRVKADLDAMVASPSCALSMGDGGVVVDPMAQTLAVLEKGLADLPRLLTTDASALSVAPQPVDADVLSEARIEEVANSMARHMGITPQSKAS